MDMDDIIEKRKKYIVTKLGNADFDKLQKIKNPLRQMKKDLKLKGTNWTLGDTAVAWYVLTDEMPELYTYYKVTYNDSDRITYYLPVTKIATEDEEKQNYFCWTVYQ